jgi:adenine-specific DNA-methyltransferase
MDLRHPYLTRQLIAYIGSKRALLPFLHDVISGVSEDPSRQVFLDPFAGTGAVSRLARMMGFAVRSNDWEPYSFVINGCHLGINAREADGLFASRGGLAKLLAELNTLPPVTEERAYISRHYAPRRTDTADWRTERLFYTRENALVIDAIRERIEELYPGTPTGGDVARAKAVLLAPLLYESATHTNTSGVFKACHRGFGGHGRDALGRIMGRIRLEPPVLVDSGAPAVVACMDAALFLAAHPGDVCYLDPPYATHQYGSNYFMLNTIALWDRPAVSDERGADGRLVRKAGIRPDWTRTRSEFCYRDTALPALREVFAATDCRHFVVSYSDEGLIGLEELCDLLSAEGELSVHSTGHVKYPGGKQSPSRSTRNRELALVVRRGRAAGTARGRASEGALLDIRLSRLIAGSFDPVRIRAAFRQEAGSILVPGSAETEGGLAMRHFWRFGADEGVPRFQSEASASAFADALAGCLVTDAGMEIDILLGVAGSVQDTREIKRLLREALRLLNRLAHHAHRESYRAAHAAVSAFLSRATAAPDGIGAALESVHARAERRLAASASTKKKRP